VSQLVDKNSRYQEQIGAHRAGTCSPGPLEKLESYFVDYFGAGAIRSVETGCGASTVVFKNYATQHTAYCYNNRQFAASSVKYAQEFPGFREDRVN